MQPFISSLVAISSLWASLKLAVVQDDFIAVLVGFFFSVEGILWMLRFEQRKAVCKAFQSFLLELLYISCPAVARAASRGLSAHTETELYSRLLHAASKNLALVLSVEPAGARWPMQQWGCAEQSLVSPGCLMQLCCVS